MATSTEIKKTIFKLVEEDEEFRLALAAKLGILEILRKMEEHDRKFNEILERLDKHEEIFLRHEEELKRIWEKLEQHDRKFNEILERLDRHELEIKRIWEKLEQHDRKFNEILERLDRHEQEIRRIWEKLEQHDRKFNEILERLDRHEIEIKRIWEKLEQHDRKFNEILAELRVHRRKLEEHDRRFSRIELELDALTEYVFTKDFYREIIELITREGDKVIEVYRNYRVDDLDIDLLMVTERRVYVVEVKIKPKKKDVSSILRKAKAIAHVYRDKEILPVLTSTWISDTVMKYALNKKIIVYDGFLLRTHT